MSIPTTTRRCIIPSKSTAQHNFMALAATDPKFAKEHNIDPEVAKEFLKADKGKKFTGAKSHKKPGSDKW